MRNPLPRLLQSDQLMRVNYPFSLRQVTSTTLFLVCLVACLFVTGVLPKILLSLVVALMAALAWSQVFYKTLPPPRRSAVFVTGCSSGMGKAVAQSLSRAGVHVFAGVRKQSDAKQLLQECGTEGSKLVHPIIVDVTSQKDIDAAVKSVQQGLNDLSLVFQGVVNNAGYPETGPMECVPMDRVRYQFEVNVFGQIAVTNAFLPLLRESASRLPQGYSPRVVFISSVVGKFVMPLLGVYSASKFAVEAIGDAYRRELSPWGIDVCLVEPGAVATKFVSKFEDNLESNVSVSSSKEPVNVDGDEMKESKKGGGGGAGGRKDGQHHSSNQDGGSAVAQVYETGRNRLLKAASHTMYAEPELVAKRVQSALYDTSPYTRYTVGLDSDATLSVATHLPDIMMDKVFQFLFGFMPGQSTASVSGKVASKRG